MRLSYLALFLVLAGITATGHAQQQQEENTLLPEIDPQDIEIRSQFQARFPGLTRQPILGFDPSQRVFRIDPNRMPFMESRDDVVATLPVSQLSRPAPPGYVPMEYSGPVNAFARGGFGSFATPEAQFWGVYKPTNTSYVGGDLDFSTAFDGHLDRPSTFRNLKANAEYGTKLDERTQLDLYGGGLSNSGYSPGTPASVAAAVSDFGKRSVTGLHLGTELRRMKNGVQGWKATAGFRTFGIDITGQSADRSGSEGVYHADARYQWAGSRPRETWQLKGGIHGGYHSREFSSGSQAWFDAGVTAVYDRLINYNTQLNAQAGLVYLSNYAVSSVLPDARLTLKHWISDRLTLELRGFAEPGLETREELYSRNRFLGEDVPLRHSYNVGGAAEVAHRFFEEGRVYGGAGLDYLFTSPVFISQGAVTVGNTTSVGFFDVNYHEISLPRLYGGISHALVSEIIWFSAEAYYQIPVLQDGTFYGGSTRVPNMEKWGLNGSISFRPIDRISIEGWGDVLGPRNSGGDRLETIFLLGGEVTVEIGDRFGVYAKFVNLLSQEYQRWKGYTERPLQVFGGVTLKL